MKPIRWWFWAALAAGGVVWLILGFTIPQSVNANDIFNAAAIAKFLASLAFIVVYTVAGILGPAKWWKTNVGTYIVLAAVASIAGTAPVAYAVLFNHGMLNTWWLAWAWIGGIAMGAAVWTLLAWLWLRNRVKVNGTP